jgi:hypothetical protein
LVALPLAQDRFQFISAAGSEPDELLAAIKRMLGNEPETRGSNFEKAIARVKRPTQFPLSYALIKR